MNYKKFSKKLTCGLCGQKVFKSDLKDVRIEQGQYFIECKRCNAILFTRRFDGGHIPKRKK
jgi:transcription elongation factor Elf1